MTKDERRRAAAEKRLKAAEIALNRACDKRAEATRLADKRTMPAIIAARRKVQEARQDMALAELAVHGISHMKTIIRWKARHYVVRVTNDGWLQMIQVGKNGIAMADRVELSPPWPALWSECTVTDHEVQE